MMENCDDPSKLAIGIFMQIDMANAQDYQLMKDL